MEEFCDRCKSIDDNLRTLSMACFYEMLEMGLPFKEEHMFYLDDDTTEKFYTLRVCKTCRAQWMAAIINWFFDPQVETSCGSGIFVRELGAVKEISEDEWYLRNPDKEPVRFKGRKQKNE